MTTDDYFKLPETNRRMELIYGSVREPPSPFGDHQTVVFRVAALIDAHARQFDLGRMFISPLDVLLDREAKLVVQPDVLFVAKERLHIVRGLVTGAPDLVVEVASPATEQHDRTLKLAWYRRYGVRECWLVNPRERRIEVVTCEADTRETFSGQEQIRSTVLPQLEARADECFE